MKRHGFTLLELMVAVLITSLLIIGAYSLLSGPMDGYKNETERKILESNLRNAELILQRDLSRVGYHAVMDSQYGFFNQAANGLAGFNSRFQGFTVLTPKTSNNKFIGEQFALVDDLNDLGFIVNSQNGNVLTMEQNVASHATAEELYTIVTSANPDVETLPARVAPNFANAFQREFAHAKAIFAFSPNNDSSLTNISSSNGVDTSNFQVTLAASPNAALGFPVANSFAGVVVYPVVGVTYRIVESNNNGFSLQRCYTAKIEDPGVANDKVEGCQIIIRNLQSFELFPIIKNSEVDGANITSFITSTDGDGIFLGNDNHFMSDTLKASCVTKLVGFVYRIQSSGMRKVGNVPAGSQGYDDQGRPLSTIQGSVLLTTNNSFLNNTKRLDGTADCSN